MENLFSFGFFFFAEHVHVKCSCAANVCDCSSGGGVERGENLSLSLPVETTRCLLLPPSPILAPLRRNLFMVLLPPEEAAEEVGRQVSEAA